MANITPYTRATYPTIEGNDRVYFDSEFRKIQECIRSIISALQGDTQNKTIASGVISLDQNSHMLRTLNADTESAAASDDLDTVNNGKDGQLMVIRAANSARTVVVKDGTGNFKLSGDMTLDNAEDTLTVLNVSGTTWYELGRSNNGA